MENNLNIDAANALLNKPLQVDPTPKTAKTETNLNIEAAKAVLGKPNNKFSGLDVPGNYMSKFDFQLKVNANNEEIRARRTPTSTKWVNGIVNFAAIAGATAVETVTDITYGIPKAIANKDANLIFDNDASRYLDSIKDNIKERFPHYYTKAEEDAGLLKGLTSANFWADKVLGGLGFTAGALVGGFGVGAAMKFSTKAAKLAIKGGVKATSIAEATNAIGKTGAAYTGLTAFETGVVYTASAVAESAVEAREGKDSFVRNATNDFILKHGRTPEGSELTEIKEASEVLGNVRFAMNLPIVGFSNAIQFGKILKGGTAAFKPNNIIRVGKNFIKAPSATKAERIAKGIYNPLTEAAQELSQYTVEKYLDDYYRNTYNNENLDKLGQAAESAAFALKESFGTKEGQEQALIGFLIGSIGAPGRTGTGKIGIRMEGGIWDAFRGEDTQQDLYTESLLKELNAYVDSDVFQKSYNSFVKANSNNFFAKATSNFEGIDGVADLAARVSLANKSNTFDSFIEDIKLLKDLSFEEFTKEFGGTNTKIFDKATQDDFVEAMISKAYKLQTLENKINSIYGDKHELARAALYDAASNIEFIGEKITEFEAGLDGKSLIDLNEFTLKEFEKGLKEGDVLSNLDNYVNTTYSNLSKDSKKDLGNKFEEFYYLKDVEKKFLKLYNDIAGGTDFDKKSIEADKRIRAEKAEEAKVKKAQEEKDAFEKDKAIVDEKVKNNTLTQEDIDNLNINHPNFKSEINTYNETLKSVNDTNRNKANKEALTQEELDGITDVSQKGFAVAYPAYYRSMKKYIDNDDYYQLKKAGKRFLRLIEEQDEKFIENPSYIYLKNFIEDIKDEQIFNNEDTLFSSVPAVDDTTPDDAPIVFPDSNTNPIVITPTLAEVVIYSVEAFTIEEQISELENVVNSEEFATTEILKKHWQTRKDLLANKIKQLRQLLKEGIKTGEDVHKATILLNDIRGTLNEGIDLNKTEYLVSLENKFRELAKNIESTFPQKLIQDYINYMNDKIKSRGMSIEKDLVKFTGLNAYTLDGKNEEYFLTNINKSIKEAKTDIERRKGLNGVEEIIFSNPNFKLEGFEIDGNYWNVVTSTDRAKVLVNINGVIVPFYLTTGQAGKGLVAGWYPFFGIGKDGWLNKTDKSDMEAYYERYWGKEVADIVKSVSDELNSFYGTDPATFKNDGDPNATSRPLTTLADKVEDYINSKLSYTPAINNADARKTLRSNVEQLGKEIIAKYDAEPAALSTTDAKADIERRREEELEALPFDEEAKQRLEFAKTKGQERYLRELKLQASKIAGRVDTSTGKSILIPSGSDILEKHDAEDVLNNPSSSIESRIMAIQKLAEINKPYNEARKSDILKSIDKIKSGAILGSGDLEIKKIYDAELSALGIKTEIIEEEVIEEEVIEDIAEVIGSHITIEFPSPVIEFTVEPVSDIVEDTTQIVADNKDLIEALEKENEQLEQESVALTDILQQAREKAKLVEVIEEVLTPEVVATIAEEEGITEEEVTEKVLEALREPEKPSVIGEILSALQKAVLAIRKVIGSLALAGVFTLSITSFATTIDTNFNTNFDTKVLTEGVVNDIMYSTPAQWAKRFLDKKGLIEVAEEQMVPIAAKPVVVVKPKPSKFFQIIGTVPDSYTAKDSIYSYRSQWDNADGFRYIPVPVKKDLPKEGLKVKGVIGVGHFMLDGSAFNNYSHEYNKDYIEKAKRENHWVPVFKKNADNSVQLSYKKANDLKVSDNVISPLRQMAFSDITFDKTRNPEGFKKTVREVLLQDGTGTYLIYKDRNAYSRFSGGSVVFIFKDKYDNTIVRDFAGSLNQIENEGIQIQKEYNLNPKDLILGYHDVGSFSAKPKAVNGEIDSKQWSGFNNEGWTGGALLIPIEGNIQPTTANVPNTPTEASLLGLLGLFSFYRKKLDNDENLSEEDELIILNRIYEIQLKINQNLLTIKQILADLETPYNSVVAEDFFLAKDSNTEDFEEFQDMLSNIGGGVNVFISSLEKVKREEINVILTEEQGKTLAAIKELVNGSKLVLSIDTDNKEFNGIPKSKEDLEKWIKGVPIKVSTTEGVAIAHLNKTGNTVNLEEKEANVSSKGGLVHLVSEPLLVEALLKNSNEDLVALRKEVFNFNYKSISNNLASILELSTSGNAFSKVIHLQKLLSRNVDNSSTGEDYRRSLTRWKTIIENDFAATQTLRNRLLSKIQQNGVDATVDTEVNRITSGAVQFAVDKENNYIFRTIKEFKKGKLKVTIASTKLGENPKMLFDLKTGEPVYNRYIEEGEKTLGKDFESAFQYLVIDGVKGKAIPVKLFRSDLGDNLEARDFVYNSILEIIDAFHKDPEATINNKINNLKDKIRVFTPISSRFRKNVKGVNAAYFNVNISDKIIEFTIGNDSYKIYPFNKAGKAHSLVTMLVNDELITGSKAKAKIKDAIKGLKRNYDYRSVDNFVNPLTGKKEDYYDWIIENDVLSTNVADVKVGKKFVGNIAVKGHYPLVLTLDSTGLKKEDKVDDSTPDKTDSSEPTTFGDDLWFADVKSLYNNEANIPEITDAVVLKHSKNVITAQNNSEFFENILANTESTLGKTILNHFINNNGIKLVVLDDSKFFEDSTGKTKASIFARYSRKRKTIFINPKKFKTNIHDFTNHVLVHELGHQLTVDAVMQGEVLDKLVKDGYKLNSSEKNIHNLYKELNVIFNEYLKRTSDRSSLSSINLLEFIAEAISNKNTIKELQKLQFPKEVIDSEETIQASDSFFDRIINSIVKFFNKLFKAEKAPQIEESNLYDEFSKILKSNWSILNDFKSTSENDTFVNFAKNNNQFTSVVDNFSIEEEEHLLNSLTGFLSQKYQEAKNTSLKGSIDETVIDNIEVYSFKSTTINAIKKKIDLKVAEVEKTENPTIKEFKLKQLNLLDRTLKDLENNNTENSIWVKINENLISKLNYDLDDIDVESEETANSLVKNWEDTTSLKPFADRVSDPIRTLVYNLPLVKNISFNTTVGKFEVTVDQDTLSGLVEFVDYNLSFNYLRETLVGIVNIDDMMNRLYNITTIAPFYGIFYNKIIENKGNIKDGLYALMSTPDIDIENQRITEIDGNLSFKTAISNIKAEHRISNKWITTFKYKDEVKAFTPENLIILQNKINKAKNLNTSLEDKINIAEQLLDAVGINIDKKTIIKIINSNKEPNKKLVVENVFINTVARVIRDYAVNERFDSYKTFNSLAKLYKKYDIFLGENTFKNVTGKTEGAHRMPSFITTFIDEIVGYKKGNNLAESKLLTRLQGLALSPSNKYSNWLWNTEEVFGMLLTTDGVKDVAKATLNREFFNYFNILGQDGLKNTTTGVGKKYNTQNSFEWNLNNAINYLTTTKYDVNSELIRSPFLTMSNSPTRYDLQVKRIAVKEGDITFNKNGIELKTDSSLFNAIYNTTLQEVERMHQATLFMYETEEVNGVRRVVRDEQGNLIINRKNEPFFLESYHFHIKGGVRIYQQNKKPVGRVFEFHNIPSLNSVDSLFMQGIVYKDVYNSIDNTIAAEEAIQKEISGIYKEFYKTNNKFKKILSPFFTVANKKFLDSDYNTFLVESSLNYYINNVELQNFIFGVTAEYANNVTVNKRAKAPGSPGEKGSLTEIGDTRNILIVDDIISESSVYNLMVENTTKDIMEETGVEETKAKALATSLLADYKKIKTSDGGGYIMLDFLEKTLKEHGRYETYKDLFAKIKANQKLNYLEVKTLLGVFKFHDYSRNFDENVEIVVSKQFKYAAVPYIPQMFETNPKTGERTQISKLIESIAIKDENNNTIGYKADEVVYKSGKKFGHFQTNIIVDINNNLLDNLDNLVFEKAKNENWTLQQETPTDYEDYAAKLAVQISKFILTNIPFEHNYNVDGTNVKGSDVIALFQDNLVKLLEFSRKVVDDKLGITYDEFGEVSIDLQTVVDFLKSDTSKPLSSNLKAALTIDEKSNKLYLPLDANTTKDTFMSSLLSVWSNNVTKQKMPGFHAIVASDALMYDVAHSGELDVKFVDGVWVIETWLPAWSSDFYEKGELIDINKLDVNLRRLIAYRIPTSGKHSVAVLEVVGFLPKEIGATMVVNKDLITRTGMDFDIDSLYVMVAHHEKTDDGFKKLDTKRKPTNKEYLKDLKAFKSGKQLQEVLNQFNDNYFNDRNQLISEKKLILSRESTVIKNIFRTNVNLQTLFSDKFKEFEVLNEAFEDEYEILEKELVEFNKILAAERANLSLTETAKITTITDSFLKAAFNTDKFWEFRLDVIQEMAELQSKYITDSNNMIEDIIKNVRIGDKLVDKLNKVQNTLLQSNIDEIKRINTSTKAAESEYKQAIYDLTVNHNIEKDNLISLYVDSLLEYNTVAQRQNVTFNVMMSVMSNSTHQLEAIEPAQFPETLAIAAKLNGTKKKEPNPVDPNVNGNLRDSSVGSLSNTGLSASNAGTWAVLQTVRAKSSQSYSATYPINEILFTVEDLIKKHGSDNVIVSENSVTIVFDKFGWNNDGTFININGKKYSYINGLLTDHSVDSVANPLPRNINEVTFNVISAVNNITGDIELALLLVNQPIILEMVENYYNANNIISQKFLSDTIKDTERYLFGSLYNLLVQTKKIKENKLFEQGLKDAKFRVKNETLKKYLGVDRSLNKVFSIKDLDNAIQKSKQKTLTLAERIEYIQSQIIALKHFKELDKLGKKILKLSTIFAVDKIGAGPSTTKTHDITFNITELAKKDDFYIEESDGTRTNLIKAIFPKLFGIDKKSVHPLIEAYYLNSNKAGADAMESLFITESAFFRQAFNDLRTYIPITQYNKIDGIKRSFDKFINTKLYRNNDAFKLSDVQIKTILGLNNTVVDSNKTLTFEDFLTYPIFNQIEVVKNILKLKTTETHIINYIEVKPATKTQGKKLQFNNIKEDAIEKRLRRSLDEMYYSNDPYVSLLGKNLVLYADLAWGLAPVTDSYAKIISLDILVNEFNVGLGLYNFDENNHYYKEFSESFLRNNTNILPLTKTQVDWDTQKVEGIDWRLTKDNVVLIHEDYYHNLDADQQKDILKIPNSNENLSLSTEILIKKVGIINGFMVYVPLSLLGSRNLIETGDVSILDSNKINDELSDLKIESLKQEEEKEATKAEKAIELAKKVVKRLTTDISNFINHSGGAIGADSAWDTIGETFGMINNYHYFYGDKTPKGNKVITTEELKEGVIRVKKTYKILGRPDIPKYYPLHGRNWFQVKNSDAVYAVSTILSPNEVDKKGYTNKSKKSVVEGGTGYAVEMAIQIDKPVYVFNQRKTQDYEIGWYQWDSSENDFIKVGTPILTKDFAGIGTRELNAAGEAAIKEVYIKTIESLEKDSNNGNTAEYIYSQLGDKTQSENVKIVEKPYEYSDEQKKGNAVVAYKSTKMPTSFENPFHMSGKTTKENVIDFIDFVLSSNEPQAEWIREQIKSGKFKNKPIYYGNTKANKANEPSHATALDYLINKYNWNTEQTVTVVSEAYGVIQAETTPTKEKTQQFVDIIKPQIKAQTYKENKGKFANEMFHYGLMWARTNPLAKPVKIDSFDKNSKYYSYHSLDQKGNQLPSLGVLNPIIREIEKAIGVDMSVYDSVIGNIYTDDQYIYPHKDTTESVSARNYPVIVYTIGNDAGLGIVDDNDGKMTFANKYDKQWLPDNEKLKGYTNELQTTNGSIYTFGLNGKGRFELTHSTPMNSKKMLDFPAITLPNGEVITKYTITLTFRRAQDLGNLPSSPAQFTKNTVKSTSKKGTQTSMDFSSIPDKDAEDKNEQCKTKK